MGNVSSVLFPPYSALSENRLDQTELQFYIDLASAQLKSKILHVSDEFFGDAANLLKLEECKTRKNIGKCWTLQIDNAYIVLRLTPSLSWLQTVNATAGKRSDISTVHRKYTEREHWKSNNLRLTFLYGASVNRVTIQLGIHGHVRGFDIDTTSFNDASPISVTVEAGRSIQWQEQTQVRPLHADVTCDRVVLTCLCAKWDIVLPNVEIQSNRHNLFTINNNHNTYSQIRVTMPSGGGIVSKLACIKEHSSFLTWCRHAYVAMEFLNLRSRYCNAILNNH